MRELLQSSGGGELGHQCHHGRLLQVLEPGGKGKVGFSEVLSVPKAPWGPNCGLAGPGGVAGEMERVDLQRGWITTARERE